MLSGNEPENIDETSDLNLEKAAMLDQGVYAHKCVTDIDCPTAVMDEVSEKLASGELFYYETSECQGRRQSHEDTSHVFKSNEAIPACVPHWLIGNILSWTVAQLSEEVRRHVDADDVGSTLVLSLMVHGQIYTANLGDSMAVYVGRDPNKERTEQDCYRPTSLNWLHNVSDPDEQARLKEHLHKDHAGILRYWDKDNYTGLTVTAGLGDDDYPLLRRYPSLSRKAIEEGGYLLLMCDGVAECLRNIQVADAVQSVVGGNVAHAIREVSYLLGSKDNISVAALRLMHSSIPIVAMLADGHGGKQVAQYIRRHIERVFYEQVKACKADERYAAYFTSPESAVEQKTSMHFMVSQLQTCLDAVEHISKEYKYSLKKLEAFHARIVSLSDIEDAKSEFERLQYELQEIYQYYYIARHIKLVIGEEVLLPEPSQDNHQLYSRLLFSIIEKEVTSSQLEKCIEWLAWAYPDVLKSLNENNNTALGIAFEKGAAACVGVLIKQGANCESYLTALMNKTKGLPAEWCKQIQLKIDALTNQPDKFYRNWVSLSQEIDQLHADYKRCVDAITCYENNPEYIGVTKAVFEHNKAMLISGAAPSRVRPVKESINIFKNHTGYESTINTIIHHAQSKYLRLAYEGVNVLDVAPQRKQRMKRAIKLHSQYVSTISDDVVICCEYIFTEHRRQALERLYLDNLRNKLSNQGAADKFKLVRSRFIEFDAFASRFYREAGAYLEKRIGLTGDSIRFSNNVLDVIMQAYDEFDCHNDIEQEKQKLVKKLAPLIKQAKTSCHVAARLFTRSPRGLAKKLEPLVSVASAFST